MPAKKQQAEEAGEAFGRLLREIRERHGITQAQLAQRMAGIGAPIQRATIAKIERRKDDKGKAEDASTRTQNVSLQDVLAFGVALGVKPIELFVPRGDDEYLKVGNVPIDSAKARSWLRHLEPLRPEDSRIYHTERPDREWANVLAAPVGAKAGVPPPKVLGAKGEQ